VQLLTPWPGCPGFSEAADGFGAGIVYLGYMLLEIPSNLLLEKTVPQDLRADLDSVGHHKYFDCAGEDRHLVLHPPVPTRLVRSWLTSWCRPLPHVLVPSHRWALMLGLFQTSIPITGIIGGPLSGWIMNSMGGQMHLRNS
jgi:hypothetical protein